MLPVTGLYAALLAGAFLVLSLRAIGARRRYRAALGTPHRIVERAVRTHGNFAEYVPLSLVLLAALELNGLPGWALHALGLTLLAGRGLHAWGISWEPEAMQFRVLGMGLTFTVLGVAAAALLGLVLAIAAG